LLRSLDAVNRVGLAGAVWAARFLLAMADLWE
jgi:hypothetical protein